MTKVLLLNTTNLANKGSMGRIEGLISCLKQSMPDAQITILHRYYNKDKDTLVKQLLKKYPDLKIQIHPWFRESSTDIFTAINSLIRFSFLFTSRSVLQLLSPLGKSDFQQYDVVIDLNLIEPADGDHFIMTIGAFFALLNTWYATMKGKPVVVCSATIGPYKSRFLGRFLRLLATYVLNKVDIITFREEFSKDYAQKLHIVKPRFYSSTDLAFLLEPINTERKFAILESVHITLVDKPLIGIAVADMKPPSLKYTQYIQLIAELSDFLIEELKATIVFITHTTQDAQITKKIFQKVKNKQKAKLLPTNLSASEMKGIISIFDMFISSRFHTLVASTSQAIPSLGIVTYSKFKLLGIIGETMGQKKYLLDLENKFNYDVFLSELKSRVKDLWMNRFLISEDLKKRGETVKEQALLNGNIIKELCI